MARVSKLPDLPTTPGGWLACYRYRLKRRDGSASSPEHLAHELAVSGDTIRRWEAGLAKPSELDLLHFSQVCGLSGIEQGFLLDAFAVVEAEAPPQPDVFRKQASFLLSDEVPAYIFDSLFYVRAWNSYIDLVHNYPFDPDGENMIQRIFSDPDPRVVLGPTNRTRGERAEWWLHSFWYQTARLCGSPAYVQALEHLGRNPRFAERWLALGLECDAAWPGPIGGPTFLEAGKGTFRISTSVVVMPPAFYLREFVPMDELGWEQLSRRREQGPPQVSYIGRNHWATQ